MVTFGESVGWRKSLRSSSSAAVGSCKAGTALGPMLTSLGLGRNTEGNDVCFGVVSVLGPIGALGSGSLEGVLEGEYSPETCDP